MQGFQDQKSQTKRLGDLLLESGMVNQADLQRAVDIGRSNFQSLGKVLISLKFCREQQINDALEMQKYCKLEGMSGTVAVRALTLMNQKQISSKDALEKVGWSHPQYKMFEEPQEVVAAKRQMKDQGAYQGVDYGKALEVIGDAYLQHKLPARAEVKYEEAVAAFEDSLPESACELSSALSKLGTLSMQNGREDEAKAFLARAQACLEGTGNKQSKEYVKVLHVSAEFNIAKKKFGDADQHYIDCFNMLSPICGLEDDQVLDTVRRYVENMGKAKRQPEQVTLGELFKGAGVLRDEQLTTAWQASKRERIALGKALRDLNMISEPQLQMALQVQILVRNNEITTQLAIWLILYCLKLGKGIDEILEMFNCRPKSRAQMIEELKEALEELSSMEARLPPQHLDLAFMQARVARLHFKRQQWGEADRLYKTAIESLVRDPESPGDSVLEVCEQYCDLKVLQDDLDESIRIAKTIVQLRSRFYGQLSVPYAMGIDSLAQLFCRKGDHSTAVGCYDRAITVREKLHGAEDRDLLGSIEGKGDCQVHAGDLTEAEKSFDRAFAIVERVHGRQNEVSERIIKKLVEVCKRLGRNDKLRMLTSKATF